MKKVKSGKSSVAAKSTGKKSVAANNKAPRDFSEYLASVPPSARKPLNQIRDAIRSAAPTDAVEVISYSIPAFKYKRVLVWFGAFSDHTSFFPTPALIEAFKADLQGFFTSKGTIHFPLNKPVPIALIKKMVKARVAQVEKKS